MSKFGAIIEQAKSQNAVKTENNKTRKQESVKTVKPANQNTGKQENVKAGKTESMNAGKQENQKSGRPESQNTVKPVYQSTGDRGVNLSIKVPESRRRHWASEAKRQGTSLTAVILESLSKRFGEPE